MQLNCKKSAEGYKLYQSTAFRYNSDFKCCIPESRDGGVGGVRGGREDGVRRLRRQIKGGDDIVHTSGTGEFNREGNGGEGRIDPEVAQASPREQRSEGRE